MTEEETKQVAEGMPAALVDELREVRENEDKNKKLYATFTEVIQHDGDKIEASITPAQAVTTQYSELFKNDI